MKPWYQIARLAVHVAAKSLAAALRVLPCEGIMDCTPPERMQVKGPNVCPRFIDEGEEDS